MTAATRTRRTVAGMDERLAMVRDLIQGQLDKAQAEYDTKREDGQYDAATFTNGVVCGYEGALRFLEWAFDPERDWMFQRGKR